VTALRQVQQLVAREHAVRMIEEHSQQPILRAAQRDRRAFRIEQTARRRIEPPLAETQHGSRFRDAHAGRQHVRATQDGTDARQQFADRKRLGHKVVGAQFEADDAIRFVVTRGQHDDGYRVKFACAQFAAQRQAVRIRQPRVEDDEIGRVALERRAHVAPAGRVRYPHAVALQMDGDEFAVLTIVIDDQHVFELLHDWSNDCGYGKARCFRLALMA